MANYQFSADIIDDILFRAGEPMDGTSDFNDVALKYLNRAYQAICSGGSEVDPDIDEVWWWLRSTSPEALILQPAITTGTVNMTEGSTGVTFSSAPVNSVDGHYLKIDGHPDVFRIVFHNAGEAAATLDAVYTGETDAAAAYSLIQLEYSFSSSVYKVLAPLRVYRNSRLEVGLVDLPALETRYPLPMLTCDIPHLAAMVGESKIRFSHYPAEAIRVDFDFLRRATLLTDDDSEEPIVPHEYRRLLADAALFFLHSDKMDSRAGDALNLAKAGLTAMAKEHRRRTSRAGSKTYGKIQPRADHMARQRGPLRTSSGMIIG